MRIKLKKGFQRKLVLIAKGRGKFTWKSLSKELGIVENYLKNDILSTLKCGVSMML